MLFSILERASRSQWSPLDRISNPDTVIRPILQKVFDFSRLIREAEDDFTDSAASHQVDLIKKKRRIGDRHNRFRCVDGQRPESRPFPTGENESFHRTPLYQKTEAAAGRLY